MPSSTSPIFFEDTDEYDLIASTADEQGAKLDQNPGPETARQPTPAGEDSGSPRYPDRRMRPRRARRGRLRGKRQEAAPSESGAAPPAAAPPANPPPPPPPAPVSGPPEALSILPGESLAKYSGISEPPPPAEPERAPREPCSARTDCYSRAGRNNRVRCPIRTGRGRGDGSPGRGQRCS